MQYAQLFMLNIPGATMPERGFGLEPPTEPGIIAATCRLADGPGAAQAGGAQRVPLMKWLALRRLANMAEFSEAGRQQIFASGQTWHDVTKLCCGEVER
eukprot:SAG22_NODE_1976_length_3219_cov_5.595192_3_plen_99_part_00